MRLYLSSYRIPDTKELQKLIKANYKNTTVGVITNAKDYKDDESRDFKLELLKEDLMKLGFKSVKFVDLRHFDSSDEVYKVLSQYDVIYVAGGSTPELRIDMKNCGFDEIIYKLLDEKVYIGESAGAYVVGPSIEVHEESDYHIGLDVLPDDGIGLINEVIVPHADNPDYKNDMIKMVSVHENNGHTIIKLNDNQAFVINGDEKYVITGNDNTYGDRLPS